MGLYYVEYPNKERVYDESTREACQLIPMKCEYERTPQEKIIKETQEAARIYSNNRNNRDYQRNQDDRVSEETGGMPQLRIAAVGHIPLGGMTGGHGGSLNGKLPSRKEGRRLSRCGESLAGEMLATKRPLLHSPRRFGTSIIDRFGVLQLAGP
jgi:hypothetical protein